MELCSSHYESIQSCIQSILVSILLNRGEIILTNSVSIDSPQYPKLLKMIPAAPKKLYYKGDWDEKIFAQCLAVVGARRMTRYGKQITDLLVSELAAVGITIVSGFMYGIDAAAHQATVNIQGRTIACMPCGIDIIHPSYQKKLYEQILDNHGLIISEYETNFFPAKRFLTLSLKFPWQWANHNMNLL